MNPSNRGILPVNGENLSKFETRKNLEIAKREASAKFRVSFKELEKYALGLAESKGGVIIQHIIHPVIIEDVAYSSLPYGKKGIYKVP